MDVVAVLDDGARAIERRRRQRVVIVSDAEVAPASRAAARLTELETLRRQGLVTEEEYERKRQAILDEV